ncbi:hypothetical protein EMCRGX_G004783 [Ephydatia muelleri]
MHSLQKVVAPTQIPDAFSLLASDLPKYIPRDWVDVSPKDNQCVVICKPFYLISTMTATVKYTVRIQHNCSWDVLFFGYMVQKCTVLESIPILMHNVQDVVGLIKVLESSPVCKGHTDAKFRDLIKHRNGKIYNVNGKCIAFEDTVTKHMPTIRSTNYEQLMKAAEIDTLELWQKCIILILDEMSIHEDLVYDKHSRELIGYTNLGDINNHLLAFEKSLSDPGPPEIANSKLMFMVQGLFIPLQFPYCQFPCCSVTGDLLFKPIWEAVYRIERCGFQVLGITFDGASANRRFLKLHNALLTLHT